MKKVCVIGAGTMGTDIAQVFAMKGIEVVIRDISDEITARAKARLEKALSRLAEKGKIDEAARDSAVALVSYTTELSAAADADLVIEAIVENVEIKKSLFKELEGICKKETIFASNTSSISITEMSSATKRTDKFIGMHFFNPASVMKLVEVIRGVGTSEETFKTIFELAEYVGKEPVEVNEAPGFVVNRILVPMINEAIETLADGVASAADIDKSMRLGANHPMGPLALSDLVGNDVVLNIMDTMFRETGDSKYRASLLLRKMVRGGLLGKKSGRGFFDYE